MSELRIEMGALRNNSENEFKPYDIGEYHIDNPFTTKNAGFSKWGFCSKDGEEYFIKEFLTPVYPDDDVDISPTIKNKRCKECMEWYKEKSVIYDRISSSKNGNIIIPLNFFKDRSHFYIVTEKVSKSAIKITDSNQLTDLNKHVILEVIAGCFSMLSQNGVVHADIKPDNMLLKETIPNFYTVKIIDFDGSYLQNNPPFGDDVQGTPEYFAPESFLALAEQPAKLTCKVDVFALGIIFHEILCGKRPDISKDYTYIYEAVLNDEEVKIDPIITSEYRRIISGMLKKDPSERWSAAKVFNNLKQISKRR